jgi:hypothetical protein
MSIGKILPVIVARNLRQNGWDGNDMGLSRHALNSMYSRLVTVE